MTRNHEWDLAKEDLQRRIPGLHLSSWGGACPFQADATIGREAFYFRYRHDEATLYVYPTGGDHFHDTTHYAEGTTNAGWDRGVLDPTEAVDLIESLWNARRPIDQVESTGVDRLRLAVEHLTAAMKQSDPQP